MYTWVPFYYLKEDNFQVCMFVVSIVFSFFSCLYVGLHLQGKLPLLSLEALHQLHIFIFVLAVVHVIFCATIVLLGRAKVLHLKLVIQ